MISGRELYVEMKHSFDFTPVIETALREKKSLTKQEALERMDAFLQWFSLIPQASKEKPLQMLGSVDPLWHAFVLNTKLYRDFCQKFAGEFIDHDPLDPFKSDLPKKEYATFTLALLEKEFGTDLKPVLRDLSQNVTWKNWRANGASFPKWQPPECGQRLRI